MRERLVELGAFARRQARRAGFAWRYRRWKLVNPGLSRADYYVERFRDRLDRPGSHANIGNVPVEPERTKAYAQEVLRLLRSLGMRPDHDCVDYGCGSLHVGEPLIDYLAPGGYRGLDVTRAFFEDALTRFDPDWLSEKRPRFDVIGPEVLAELRNRPPDFVVCSHVLILVHPSDLADFATRLTGVLGPSTRCLLELELRRTPRQATDTFYWHSRDRVERAFAAAGYGLSDLGRWPAIRAGQRDSVLVQVEPQSPRPA